jgi:hypothetical protein
VTANRRREARLGPAGTKPGPWKRWCDGDDQGAPAADDRAGTSTPWRRRARQAGLPPSSAAGIEQRTPGRGRTDTGTLLGGWPLPLGYGGAKIVPHRAEIIQRLLRSGHLDMLGHQARNLLATTSRGAPLSLLSHAMHTCRYDLPGQPRVQSSVARRQWPISHEQIADPAAKQLQQADAQPR